MSNLNDNFDFSQSVAWYQKHFSIIALLVIFPPIGMFLLHKYAKFSQKAKWIATGISGIWLILCCAAGFAPRVSITDLTLPHEQIIMEIGETREVQHQIFPDNANASQIEYVSSDESLVVYKDGGISAVSEGEAEVFVQSEDVLSNKVCIIVLKAGEKAKIQQIITEIDEIKTVKLDSDKAIKSARNAYNAESQKVQNLVTNISMLDAAEKKYEQLPEIVERKARAAEIDEKILALGAISLESKDVIADIKVQYDAQKPEVQQLVVNKEALVKAQQQYKELEDAENARLAAETERILAEEAAKAESERAEKAKKEAQQNSVKKESQPTGKTVYVTPTGKKYHFNGSCNGGRYSASTLEKAKARGLTPCKKCA